MITKDIIAELKKYIDDTEIDFIKNEDTGQYIDITKAVSINIYILIQ